MADMLQTPVLLLVFNRPDTTKRVFEEIRKARPTHLYIAADGPRVNKSGEAERCQQVRDIATQVDWDCEVHTLFRETNLGCRVAVSSSINWFFDQVEEGIILEDDCLPDQSFFWFCQELLEKYRDNEQVMHIGGSNFQFGQVRGESSYYFSRIAHIWGWASWRRAWQYYDVNMQKLPDFIEQNRIAEIFHDKAVQKQWVKSLKKVSNGVDTWDYQWAFAIFEQGGYTIIPNNNLVSNIGFGDNSTHSVNKEDKIANIKLQSINYINHPSSLIANQEADNFTGKEVYLPASVLKKVKNKINQVFLNYR